MSRGDRREDIFHDDVDRQDFLKTLAEACQKADFQMHAYCLMRNHFHLVVETPNGNLVAGMRWLLSAYTLRLNHRRKLFGHVFSGRYKALVVDGSSSGYLKTVCDYVHLNPVRARLLGAEDRLLSYPWSSFTWYLAAPAHRPAWMRVERLLAEHGLAGDTAEARREFERRMETRRAQETDAAEWEPVRRGWCLGGAGFRQELVERMSGKLGEHHAGELRRESAEAKAERIIAEELKRLGWVRADLEPRNRSAPEKLELAARLRRETTLTIREIAQRLHLGSWKSAATRLQHLKQKKKLPRGVMSLL
ncbi:MAG: transposase [Burkholderiales bacterium]